MPRRRIFLVSGGILLITAVLAVLDSRVAVDEASAERIEFVDLIGGLGAGPTIRFDPCPSGFDPRLGARCSMELGAIPGGAAFCPVHGGLLRLRAPDSSRGRTGGARAGDPEPGPREPGP